MLCWSKSASGARAALWWIRSASIVSFAARASLSANALCRRAISVAVFSAIAFTSASLLSSARVTSSAEACRICRNISSWARVVSAASAWIRSLSRVASNTAYLAASVVSASRFIYSYISRTILSFSAASSAKRFSSASFSATLALAIYSKA